MENAELTDETFTSLQRLGYDDFIFDLTCIHYETKYREKHKQSLSLGCIYVIENESGYIKIGITELDPWNRMQQLSTASWEELTLKAWSKKYLFERYEKAIHSLLTPFNMKGEWFSINYSQLEEILNISNALSNSRESKIGMTFVSTQYKQDPEALAKEAKNIMESLLCL